MHSAFVVLTLFGLSTWRCFGHNCGAWLLLAPQIPLQQHRLFLPLIQVCQPCQKCPFSFCIIPFNQFLNSLIDISLKVLLVLTVMGILGIKMTSFVAIVGAAGLAVGMALQGTLQNFAGGVIILLLKPFKVGDYIDQGNYAGFVESIQIFNTTLRTYDNRNIIVPNTELATKSLVNHFNLPMRRVKIAVSIAYGESVDKAREVLLRVANTHPLVLKEPKAPFAPVEELGESSVNMSVYAWCLPENYWTVLYDLNQQVYDALMKEHIEIPFNQLDVHIKTDK